jgi:hypothetical protein
MDGSTNGSLELFERLVFPMAEGPVLGLASRGMV